MVVPGGGRFLVSELPLYIQCLFTYTHLHEINVFAEEGSLSSECECKVKAVWAKSRWGVLHEAITRSRLFPLAVTGALVLLANTEAHRPQGPTVGLFLRA